MEGKTGWLLLKGFLNKRYDKEVSMYEIRKRRLGLSLPTIRKTISLLKAAGYIKTICPGVYKLEVLIPLDLKLADLEKEAYHEEKE